MSQVLQQEAFDLIANRYEILETIELDEYDCDIPKLVNLLNQYQDFVFGVNQRIVILHHDTDYYPSIDGPVVGNTLFNLFTLFGHFNIACEKIVFVTNHYGIQNEINHLAATICNSVAPTAIYTSLWYDFPSVADVPAQARMSDNITSVYCCLNGQQRQHRVLTLCYLQEYNLLKHGAVSYNFKK
jgi:hypothetical protein